MTNEISDLLDAQISLNRLIWLLDDLTYNTLFDLTRLHLTLVKEAMEPTTAPARKTQIRAEIERLRRKRDSIIAEFEKTIR